MNNAFDNIYEAACALTEIRTVNDAKVQAMAFSSLSTIINNSIESLTLRDFENLLLEDINERMVKNFQFYVNCFAGELFAWKKGGDKPEFDKYHNIFNGAYDMLIRAQDNTGERKLHKCWEAFRLYRLAEVAA